MNTEIGVDIKKAAGILKAGGLVAIPTETVYGLAANGLNARAVARIFEAKQRPGFDPLILHSSSIGKIESLVNLFPEKAKILAKHFWPGPLTLVMPKSEAIPDIATSGLATVGVRIPNHPLTLELLKFIEFPLAAPSANPFGYISPTTALHVKDQLDGKIDYILDGGSCEVGVESTIISFSDNDARILRLGGLDFEEIQAVIGDIHIAVNQNSNPTAPGMLDVHYAPKKQLILGHIPDLLQKHKGEKIAVLGFKSTYGAKGLALSHSGNMREAAQNLFAAMRTLDASDSILILAEKLPETGLGLAINDRLQRAAAKNRKTG